MPLSPKSLAELEFAAANGDVEAQFKLGMLHDNGQANPHDYLVAVRWYHRAAEQGLAKAQCMLGLIYVNGRGVAQDNNAGTGITTEGECRKTFAKPRNGT
jgi:TPR repeat protein